MFNYKIQEDKMNKKQIIQFYNLYKFLGKLEHRLKNSILLMASQLMDMIKKRAKLFKDMLIILK